MGTPSPTIKVGCCGFPVARDRYFRTFPIVEVQQTFYQPPRTDTLKRWRQEAPEEFEFSLKAWQLITHNPSSPTYRRLKMSLSNGQKAQAGDFRYTDLVRRAWDTTLEAAAALRASKVLFQCPASFAPIEENKRRMRQFFSSVPRGGLTCLWEPRGRWGADDIVALCRELELVHCVDPFLNQCLTAGLRYFRLHGIGGYRHRYTAEELERLHLLPPKEALTCCLFNNVSMFEDARRFQEALAASR